jgi:2,4-dienoyl-CoA reductase-like NADH-dependent reductase (Old Yellow Enzyme family)
VSFFPVTSKKEETEEEENHQQTPFFEVPVSLTPTTKKKRNRHQKTFPELARLGIAYIHVIEPRMTQGNKEAEDWDRSWDVDPIRRAWHAAVEEAEEEGGSEQQNGNGNASPSSSKSTTSSSSSSSTRRFIAAGGFNRQRALEHMERFPQDLVAFGRFWLSTPDLPTRLESDKPLNQYHRDTFYIPDVVKGYTDYPTLEEVEKEMDKYEVKEHYDGSKIFVLKK